MGLNDTLSTVARNVAVGTTVDGSEQQELQYELLRVVRAFCNTSCNSTEVKPQHLAAFVEPCLLIAADAMGYGLHESQGRKLLTGQAIEALASCLESSSGSYHGGGPAASVVTVSSVAGAILDSAAEELLLTLWKGQEVKQK